MMVYCNRNAAGTITAMFAMQQYPGQQQVDDGSAEVVAFYASLPIPTPLFGPQVVKDLVTAALAPGGPPQAVKARLQGVLNSLPPGLQ